MKKKVIAGVMSMMMVMAMAVPVFAKEEPETEVQEVTEVTYVAPSSYKLSIPKTIELETEQKSVNIIATEVNIAPERELRVRVVEGIDAGNVTLTRSGVIEEGNQTTSKVSIAADGAGITNTDVVATFEGQGTNVNGGALYFAGLDQNLKAGTWTGKITFQVELGSVN